jgi:hypothetical protein
MKRLGHRRRRPKETLCARAESAAVAEVELAARMAVLTAAVADSLLPLKVE